MSAESSFGVVEPHFLVLVPGYMGSLLRDKQSGEIVWIDFPALLKDPLHIAEAIDELVDKMVYPNDNLEPAGIMDQVLFVPPWAKQEHYGRLLEQFEKWGYQVDPEDPTPDTHAAYTFPYDWRQDNRDSARQLGESIRAWRERHQGAKAWLIAHSNGGIVSRWYIEKEGGSEHVGRLFLMGSPWDGAPKSMKVMMDGMEVLGMRRFNLFGLGDRMKNVIRTFPSFYQLLPHAKPFLTDQDNHEIDIFADTSWLDDPLHKEFLADALKFNQELGTSLSVDRVAFFGRMKPTVSTGVVEKSGHTWGDIQWIKSSAGDGTVPVRSAVHPGNFPKYAFNVDHGSIYVDPQVLPQLEWELIGQFSPLEEVSLQIEDLVIVFDAGEDVYAPGEEIKPWLTVHRIGEEQPLSGAEVSVKLVWSEPLPGSEVEQPPEEFADVPLKEVSERPGIYTGVLPAPDQEGYYHLQARVTTPDTQAQLSEMILVEAV